MVWTGDEEKLKKLSEVARSSDRLWGKTEKAVRSNSKFGQVMGENRKSCPK
jgi:hypothetical protein